MKARSSMVTAAAFLGSMGYDRGQRLEQPHRPPAGRGSPESSGRWRGANIAGGSAARAAGGRRLVPQLASGERQRPRDGGMELGGMKAVIYARYSSDLQSPASIEDQVRLCREHAAQMGVEVVNVYSDAAISGSRLQNRPGIQSLLGHARKQNGSFDIVITEALDRLSRDQEDMAGLFKRLVHCDIRIHTLSEGEISE